jgi:rhodanese-related sulfurtransferase
MIATVRANNEGVTDLTVSFMPAGAESACVCAPPPSERVASITVDEVSATMSEQRLLLDVREPHEFTGPMGHIPGAILIPLGELPMRLPEIESHKHEKVIAICRSGGRSAQATAILMNAGFANVLNMIGGTLAWTKKGYPVEH